MSNDTQKRVKYLKIAYLGTVTAAKIILCIYTTRIIPLKVFCKVPKQIIIGTTEEQQIDNLTEWNNWRLKNRL